MANVTGWTGNETVNGTTAADSVAGFAGNDVINANAGADSIYGGSGGDTVTAGDGADLVYGDADRPQTWAYRVYDRDFTSANGQAFTIESGTLRGSGLASSFDVTNQILAARGTTGNPEDYGVIYTATFTATVAGTYTFSTTSDDGSAMGRTAFRAVPGMTVSMAALAMTFSQAAMIRTGWRAASGMIRFRAMPGMTRCWARLAMTA